MPTTNEILRDEFLRHQIRLLRYARGLERELLELLIERNAPIRDAIEALLRRFPASGFAASSAAGKLDDFAKRLGRIQRPLELEFRELLRSRLVDLGAAETAWVAGVFASALPVVLEIRLPGKAELRKAILSQPHGGLPLSDWDGRLWTGDRQRIVEQVTAGIQFGESRSSIVRRVFGTRSLKGQDGIRQVTANAVATLARSLSVSAAERARGLVYEANAAVTREIFVATLDSRTTAICRATDGKVWPAGEGLIPPLHRNCRSLRVPYVDGRRVGTRPANAAVRKELAGIKGPPRRRLVERMVGRVPETETYSTWLRRQSVAFQNEALGVKKAKLYRDGGLELERFVDPTGRELTLTELYSAEPEAFRLAGIEAP